MRLKSGDRVRVLSGKDRGSEGQILKAFPGEGRVLVEGVHMVQRHTKARDATTPGGIIEKSLPIDASNVAIVCSSCGPTRIAMDVDEFGKRFRVCRKCRTAL
ncbi:50S ribosomal protein L24 [Ferrimicrobium acidiphilum]|uniref:Large ribosomal subunit protein uL24 n=1 Tax=Ferrimicrobium acidiphilum DSM 19497 TaxID=1121877 RepID=A0A0D8FWT7_9ACTN|nr:50S ribosomal protein L24 [Ferrimicrobium acidiphilum]KJE77718.1 50S ribosomal protein L24 [Ferrimicrobium acidiphilum DSM 19497]